MILICRLSFVDCHLPRFDCLLFFENLFGASLFFVSRNGRRKDQISLTLPCHDCVRPVSTNHVRTWFGAIRAYLQEAFLRKAFFRDCGLGRLGRLGRRRLLGRLVQQLPVLVPGSKAITPPWEVGVCPDLLGEAYDALLKVLGH
jgi:hypothetical protein